ncbi:hypothetical protein HKCCE2091_03980 [Rhodobacterales bacterium HKCCE2091]|nr:hypothetical protein [Rhodobacterales bacterium HKCCE2091]
MKTSIAAAAALLATTSLAQAGGIERSTQSMAILFEEGTHAELSFSRVFPSTSGTVGGVVGSGNVSPGYNNFALRYRQDITDQLSFALIIENHIGADVSYPAGTGYPLAGTTAELRADSVTALFRYEFPSNFSIYGGARAARISGDVFLPPVGAGYTLSTDTDTALGFVAGVAYEIPEIALRVALTYNSEYTHDLAATEGGIGPLSGTSTLEVTVPQSVLLEAQTGIAEDTLLFGSVRWVDWTEFQIAPAGYTNPLVVGAPLVEYRDDYITYTIGLGRRFSDEFSAAISASYEPEANSVRSNLGPTDGRISVGLGGTYTMANGIEIAAGVQYGTVGNVTTSIGGDFRDNDFVAAGITFGMSF